MIRTLQAGDYPVVSAINEANRPAVGPMDEARLTLLADIAPFCRVIEVDRTVIGFMLGMTESSTRYDSPNYRWFAARHARFAYVDRVAMSVVTRNQGWGARLYGAFEAWAIGEQLPVLRAEVNTIPDNPGSHRFHQRFGFTEVARCRPYDPQAEVAMYEKALPV